MKRFLSAVCFAIWAVVCLVCGMVLLATCGPAIENVISNNAHLAGGFIVGMCTAAGVAAGVRVVRCLFKRAG